LVFWEGSDLKEVPVWQRRKSLSLLACDDTNI